MRQREARGFDRRTFLRLTGGLAAISLAARADEMPEVSNPRATSGDERFEPAWQERIEIRVSPRPQAGADLVGPNERAIQAAVDYAARIGGATVRLLPGEFRLRNAVYLASGVRLVGSGAETVLIKEPSRTTLLAADSDWYDQEITLADATGFEIGNGVCLETTSPHDGGHDVVKRTLVARQGNRFKLDRALRSNFWLAGKSRVSTLFPLLSGEAIRDVVIENLTLDGNRAENANLNGNYAGCIFLQDCNAVTIRGVTARNYNGDGISWQICHDVVVEGCRSENNAGLGLHPGSGSQRPRIRDNVVRGNDIGVFFCWGVKFGLCEANRIEGNRIGVSIGHRDMHNVIRDNDILGSGEVGVLFRPERGRDFAPHHNQLVANRLRDNGPAQGVAVDVQGEVEDVLIAKNAIRETRPAMQNIGIRIGSQARDIRLADNDIQGFATAVLDERSG